MISARNLLGPFVDKRNLITIILVAVFFGVYRMSGGSVKTSNSYVPVERSIPSDSLDLSDDMSPAQDIARMKLSAGAQDTDDDVILDGSINRKPPAQEVPREINEQKLPASNTKHAAVNENKGGLSDIERSLGLK